MSFKKVVVIGTFRVCGFFVFGSLRKTMTILENMLNWMLGICHAPLKSEKALCKLTNLLMKNYNYGWEHELSSKFAKNLTNVPIKSKTKDILKGKIVPNDMYTYCRNMQLILISSSR